ncbi:hypothetical protein MLD38_007486 [Melastoma candidum]|uniref:Uncharacterized protein n=1 Tax=Melastoma candidum TaxID=119954 RepID=A0ACB9RR83_9MYRT|nr:hypothetical protein MLD38_007486 [Melastoma candidum]
MASIKADKPVGTQLFGNAKKEPAGKSADAAKGGSAKKGGTQKAAEPKKKHRHYLSALYWDYVKDWGLLQPNSRHPWLRNKLMLRQKTIYSISIVIP